MFEQKLLPKLPIEQVEIDGLRFYKSPDGQLLKSVTTVLGEKLPKPELAAWRKRVGDDEADQITLQASNRGDAIHAMCEKYLLNEEWKTGQMPFNVETFRGIKKILDKSLTEVYGVELPLYSKHLKAAGTTDLLGKFDGRPTLGDFKTARWEKEEKHIYNYFLQLTAYSIMIQEMYGLIVKQCVILMAVDGFPEPKVFRFNRDKYLDETIRIFTLKGDID